MQIDNARLYLPDDDKTFHQVDKKEWMFNFSDDYAEYFDYLFRLYNMDLPDDKLEGEYIKIIRAMPEVFDASSNLAQIYLEQDKIKEAKLVYEKAIQVARSHISKEFNPEKHNIPWYFMENRPFLRLLANYAQYVESYEHAEQAVDLYEEILSLNPNDNQGMRSVLATLYLQLQQPKKVIALAAKYKNDLVPEVAVGNVLALYQIGDHKAAQKAIKENVSYHKNVYKEILKKVHRKPSTCRDDGSVRIGGTDQAWYYWQGQGKYWKSTAGVQEFVESCLQAHKK